MKGAAIKARRKVKYAFIDHYKHLFYQIYLNECEWDILNPYYPHGSTIDKHSPDYLKIIAEKARRLIGYSKTTANYDIVWNMYAKYKRLYHTNML